MLLYTSLYLTWQSDQRRSDPRYDSMTQSQRSQRDLKKLPISSTTLPKIIFAKVPIILQITSRVESSRPRSIVRFPRDSKIRKISLSKSIICQASSHLGSCARAITRGEEISRFSGIFICLKCHRFPKTGAIRAIDDQWMRAKRIARNDIRRAMSYREEPITRAVIYDCISVPFGRRRYIIRIPTRREFIYSIIIAYNR